MQVLRAAPRVATPWKNGGGVTREVAAWPPGAGFDDFHWRVSMAEVRADGPFSVFPGVDRILAVLAGRLALEIDGDRLELDSSAAPAVFPGDVPTAGRLLAGPVVDLNVMVRRGAVRAKLERLRVDAALTLDPIAGTRLLVARDALRATGAATVDLLPDDALLLAADDLPVTLHADAPATVFLATFSARGR